MDPQVIIKMETRLLFFLSIKEIKIPYRQNGSKNKWKIVEIMKN